MTRRDGFSMIEMLLMLVLGMILLIAAFRTMSQQEKAYGLFNAIAGTQADTRMGIEFMTAGLREVSATGGDLVMATPDSIRIRGLQEFGLICDTNKSNTQLTVARIGNEGFAGGDSIAIYVDQDSLTAKDDIWQTTAISNVSATASCTTTFGVNRASLAPGSTLEILKVGGGLRFDSIYPGAPVRSYTHMTYRVGTWQGQPVLERVVGSEVAPLFGPLTGPDGFELTYFDTTGTQLTSFPLSAADRGSVERIRVELRAEQRAGGPNNTYTDSLVTEIYLRGS